MLVLLYLFIFVIHRDALHPCVIPYISILPFFPSPWLGVSSLARYSLLFLPTFEHNIPKIQSSSQVKRCWQGFAFQLSWRHAPTR
jgi:hypothetical protein